MSFDIDFITDLHIESWDTSLPYKYQLGNRKNIKFKSKPSSDILIVAGDVSDDINLSINYLNKLSKNYQYQDKQFIKR